MFGHRYKAPRKEVLFDRENQLRSNNATPIKSIEKNSQQNRFSESKYLKNCDVEKIYLLIMTRFTACSVKNIFTLALVRFLYLAII